MLKYITEFDIYLLIIVLICGFIGGLLDNSFGMGYGLLTPIFILMGFHLLIIVPSLLLSQAITGFSGSFFHILHKNIDLTSRGDRESRIVILFTTTGIIGTLFAVIFTIAISELLILLYIGIMMILIGVVVLYKINFNESWNKLIGISVIAGFNKAISGGGYGSLVTSGQLMTGSTMRNSIGVTQLSESLISILAFILYMYLHETFQFWLSVQLALSMLITGILAAPLGAKIAKVLNDETGRKTVAFLSIILGVIMLLRILLLN
ncbi:MAG: sulfite exporter TauE/SafE family protein [Promethearchaeota archaeon]